MASLNHDYIKLAIQKDGRLTEDTLNLLRGAGLDFDSYKKKLFSTCRNFPLEILFVRDDDIPGYVSSGTVDLGIIGENLIEEYPVDIKVVEKLNYGYCTIAVAVLKESTITSVTQLENKTIATSYPKITEDFFRKLNIPINIVKISGSVEITPSLGIASAIVDIVSTGSTLALNDLRMIDTVKKSRALLIGNNDSFKDESRKEMIDKLLMRLHGVLEAEDYKYIMMNAPRKIIPEVRALLPGLKAPTIAGLADDEWVSIQTVIKEDIFWDTIEKLKKIGASGILVLPIEKMIV